jgi:hypothetical protein
MHVSKIHLPIRGSASRLVLYSALAFAMVLAFSVVASAQTTDVLRVTYFDNNNVAAAPNAFVHILNAGVNGAPPPTGTGNLCASIYIWRFDQELTECCSCTITANGLLTFTVLAATSNPGDGGGIPTNGSISIISDSACDPTAPVPTPDLRAWATHVNVDANSPGGFDVTETEALDTPLSAGELAEAASRCGFLRVNGTGHGRCDAICTATGG